MPLKVERLAAALLDPGEPSNFMAVAAVLLESSNPMVNIFYLNRILLEKWECCILSGRPNKMVN